MRHSRETAAHLSRPAAAAPAVPGDFQTPDLPAAAARHLAAAPDHLPLPPQQCTGGMPGNPRVRRRCRFRQMCCGTAAARRRHSMRRRIATHRTPCRPPQPEPAGRPALGGASRAAGASAAPRSAAAALTCRCRSRTRPPRRRASPGRRGAPPTSADGATAWRRRRLRRCRVPGGDLPRCSVADWREVFRVAASRLRPQRRV